jgi:DNA-binding NarL/FixJ family response regulator
MKSILLVDDHPIFRAGLKAALADTKEYDLIGEACSVREATFALKQGKYDLMLLDLNLPDGSGLRILEQLQTQPERPQTMVLSMHAERNFAEEALKCGASGYATKNLPFATLNMGLNLIAAGELFIEGELLRDMLGSSNLNSLVDPEAQRALASLSAREREILTMLLGGSTIKEAAQRLFISVRTAENYQSSLYTKLGARSAVHLVVMALRGGMQAPEQGTVS